MASAVLVPTVQAAASEARPAVGQFHGLRVPFPNYVDIAKGGTATVQVAGVGGLPATGLDSVWLNVAARGTGGHGGLVVYPSGAGQPAVTGARYQSEGYNGDLLLVKVGADGKIKLTDIGSTATSVRVYITVHGYTLTSAGSQAGATYVGVDPARIANALSVPAGGTASFTALGTGGVPGSGVSHVVFTLVGSAGAATSLTAYPSGTTRPSDTNLSLRTGNYLDNLVVSQVGSDGKVTIANTGTVAATVWAYASGYYAAADAPVAASLSHSVQPARIVSEASIPANGDYTVAPLGKGGIPSTGVTSVAMNLTARSSGNGIVQGRPSGASGTGVWTVGYPTPNVHNAGFIAAKLGSDGKVILHNNGDSAVSVSVDVFAYFAPTPTGCTPGTPSTAAPTPTASVPQESFSRTSVMQSSPVTGGSLGKVELAYSDNIGHLLHGRANPSTLNSVEWTVVSNGDQAFTGQPGLAEQADGKLQLLGHATNGTAWTMTQTSREPATWGSWGQAPHTMASHLAVARHDDALVAFAVDAAGALWALPQYERNGAYQGWINLGMTGLSTAGAPVAVPVSGGVQIFALDTSGTWRTAFYGHGSLSDCTTVGGTGLSGTAGVVVYPGSILRIFVRGADGHILTKKQDASRNWPADWEQVGDFVADGSPAALISPVTGRTEIVARAADGKIYSTGETFQGANAWRPWVNAHESDAYTAATDPTVFQYAGTSGSNWAFHIRTQSNLGIAYPANEGTVASARTSKPATAPTFTALEMTKPPTASRR
jgi:hypothetical protein